MAAPVKLYGKDLSEYADIDLDELLSKLTEEELEEIGTELIDPDDSHIPPSDRCRYKTDKEPTGPYDRKHLVDFLAKKAKEEKDWDEAKPYTKETRGKKWEPKEEKVILHEDEAVETEWDEVLANATEEELVDLAAILGFHGMLNQVQYHQAFVEEKDKEQAEKEGSGFRGVAKHQNFKLVKQEAANETDVDDALQKLRDDDAKTTEINLNNIKNISIERLCEFGEALKGNTHLEKLHMANVRATDKVAKALAGSLSENETLTYLNLESNYISGEGIVALLEAINEGNTITEFKIANQRPQVLGHKKEMRIAELVKDNHKLMRFGIFLQVPDARIRVQEYLKRNNDKLRKQRIGEGEEPAED